MVPLFPEPTPSETAGERKTDVHLRSAREVTGYHIHASDGALGHVEDFIAEDGLWVIRYMVVHTGRLLPAKKVLISPQWLGAISYCERKVEINLTREKILNCPEYYPGAAVNREYEERLYDYYGQPTYWLENDFGANPPTRHKVQQNEQPHH